MKESQQEDIIKTILEKDFDLSNSQPATDSNPETPRPTEEHLVDYTENYKKRSFPDYGKTDLDAALMMDLEAYNYISAFLFEGMGTNEEFTEAMDIAERQQVFKEDFLSNSRIFETLENAELLPLPTLKRIHIAVTLVAMEELTALRREHSTDTSPEPSANYHRNKKMAKCYSRMIEFLVGDALSIQEKNEAIVCSMLVEFKSLHFLSDLAAGLFNGTEYQTYITDQAKVNLNSIVSLNILEQACFSDSALENIKQELLERRTELARSIDLGEISLDSAVSLATEQTLVKCLITIAIAANTEMLPVLHPGYHAHSSALIQQRAQDLVKRFRAQRQINGNTLINNPLGFKSTMHKRPKIQPRSRQNSDSAKNGEFKPARKRKIWTEEETKALEEGMAIHGNDWVSIQKLKADILYDRNPVALKDRARSMRKILERANKPLGVWVNASSRN